MVAVLAGEPDKAPAGALGRHLATCPSCARRLRTWASIQRAILEFDAPPLVGQLEAECDRAFRRAPRSRGGKAAAPAVASPEPSTRLKVIATAAVVAAMAALYTAAALLTGGRAVPATLLPARITYRAGGVEWDRSGSGTWDALPAEGDLIVGAPIRTLQDGLVRVQVGPATWSVDGSSALRFLGPLSAEVAVGRVCVEVREAGDLPVELRTASGTVSCRRGAFAARVSGARLLVTCLSGEVTLQGTERSAVLSTGQRAMAALGRLSEHVRQAHLPSARHWLKRFESAAGSGLKAGEAAPLPILTADAALPDTLRISRLSLRLQVRGPLVLATADVSVRNEGDVPWEGALDPAGLLWPPPLLSAASKERSLAPGAEGVMRCAAVLVMAPADKRFEFAVVPEAWTGRPIRSFALAFEGTAAGGVASAGSPTHAVTVATEGERVEASFQQAEFPPAVPMVFQLSFPEGVAHDLLVLPAMPQRPALGLLAYRGGFRRRDDAARIGRLLLAFDAGADYCSLGRAYAQDVAESLMDHVPERTRFGMMVHDGIEILPARVLPYGESQAERLAIALWDAQGRRNEQSARELLQEALSVGGEPTTAVMVTGRASETQGSVPAGTDGAAGVSVRPFVLQVGVDTPSEAYGAWCSLRGGAALAVRGDVAAEGVGARARRHRLGRAYAVRLLARRGHQRQPDDQPQRPAGESPDRRRPGTGSRIRPTRGDGECGHRRGAVLR